MNDFPNIHTDKNYRRIDNGDVFTGQQILNLLEVSPPALQAIVLLSIVETDKHATHPDSKYGIVMR